jgi:DNA-binding NtrC family response regulator
MAIGESLALVLEDTELGRWALRRALETQGFRVFAFGTWAEASECLMRTPVSLALVAVSTIFENVAGILGSLGQEHPDTHFILLADQDSLGELRPICDPAIDILTKPFDLAALGRAAAAGVRPSAPLPDCSSP